MFFSLGDRSWEKQFSKMALFSPAADISTPRMCVITILRDLLLSTDKADDVCIERNSDDKLPETERISECFEVCPKKSEVDKYWSFVNARREAECNVSILEYLQGVFDLNIGFSITRMRVY